MRWFDRLLPWAVGVLAGVVALGPALGRGYVLRYDMVFVPDPSLTTVLRGADGFPRAIPSDAVVAALSAFVPGDVVQAVALLAVFTVGAAGAARLLWGSLGRGGDQEGPEGAGPDRGGAPSARGSDPGGSGAPGASGGSGYPGEPAGPRGEPETRGGSGVPAAVRVASAAAGIAYVWNPFVAERLLLGQWAMLLGYAGLPWVVGAVVRLGSTRRATGFAGLLCSLIPAAVGGFSSVVLTALTAGPVALARRGRAVTTALVLLALVLVSLPWLLPSLASGAGTDPAGVSAFAARPDTPFGAAGSLLLLGGVWNSGAVPVGYGEPVTASLRLALCLVALTGWVWWLRRMRPAFGAGLSAAAVLGFAIALLGTTGAGQAVLEWLIGLWPGFGPLRDGQLYVAPLALVQALGFGAALWWLARPRSEAPTGRPGPVVRGGNTVPRETPVNSDDRAVPGPGRSQESPRTADRSIWRLGAAVFLALLPLVVLPGLVWGAGGRLVPVDYPREWIEARRAVAADASPGAVLVLPWSAYRGLDWAGERVVVLDPATKLFDRRTLWNDDLRVGTADGGTVVVTGEDARAREAAAALEIDPGTGLPRVDDVAGVLGGLGVRYVMVSAPIDNAFLLQAEGLSPVVEGAGAALYRVDDQHVKPDKADGSGLEVTGGLVTVGAIVWSVARSGSSLVLQRSGFRARPGARKEIPK
ncbi:hypothetical protein AB0I72_18690 [Nocardiopsis sp. NPDC049922]|uniref:hypothetical protein n=1 Tax=Nocardiopsis sp. NPDC049922 TaxID=3155157 RepID=UPI0033D18E63